MVLERRATDIGGNQADNSATDSGAVYVFTRSGTTWAPQAYVKASNTSAKDAFGNAIALSADGGTLAVGATGEASAATGIGGNQGDNNAASAGAAYVFIRTGTVWSQQAYVKASNTDPGDVFGVTIALSSQMAKSDGVAKFPDGTVHTHGVGEISSNPKVAIVGGTGRYAGAPGIAEFSHVANGTTLSVLRLQVH